MDIQARARDVADLTIRAEALGVPSEVLEDIFERHYPRPEIAGHFKESWLHDYGLASNGLLSEGTPRYQAFAASVGPLVDALHRAINEH